MDKDYVLRQLGVFQRMVAKGLIKRELKPVYWSPSSGTALAEAELEYAEAYESLAAFVRWKTMDACCSRRVTLSRLFVGCNRQVERHMFVFAIK